MIRIIAPPELVTEHINAVVARLQNSYNDQEVLNHILQLGVNSIEEFLAADVDTMRRWTECEKEKLQLNSFREIYTRYFSNGTNNFVDGDYNAYKFLEELDIMVCPYCDDEYLDTVKIGNSVRRTGEIDHFFSKSKYPALAMCFYNLVPSGQNCNGLKLQNDIGANPYETDIENWTWLYPDIPVGVSLETLQPEDCKIHFHPKYGMKSNVCLLALEQRYERHAQEAHRLLLNLQNYSEDKIAELVKMGYGTREEIISTVFGPQDRTEKKKTLRQKMLRDLTGY